jgi:hypothetical protein
MLVELKEGNLPEGPSASLKIPRKQIAALAKNVGLTLHSESPTLLPCQTLPDFQKP